MSELPKEVLEEVWKSKFKRAKKSEFDINVKADIEAELLRMKIDMCLDKSDKEGFERFSKQLQSIEFFLSLKGK